MGAIEILFLLLLIRIINTVISSNSTTIIIFIFCYCCCNYAFEQVQPEPVQMGKRFFFLLCVEMLVTLAAQCECSVQKHQPLTPAAPLY